MLIRPPRRLAGLIKLGVAIAILVAGGLLYLHVSLARAFEGRLWMVPSIVYSDALTVRAGERLSIAALRRRLDRSGYARTDSTAGRPGQYAVSPSRLDVHTRAFRAGARDRKSVRASLHFSGELLRAIRDSGGREVDSLTLEPEKIATFYGSRQEERRPIELAEIPRSLIHAVLAAEDARFFTHEGVDLRGILRASWANLRQGRIVQGGSTITQQTVKNLFLGAERTWWRKTREGVLSLMLDARYPKERILEVYLNEVYLGQRGAVAICGVQSAARFYFGRDVRDLSLAESALLAGLIRNPGGYNPFARPERALARREQVLAAMARLGLASEKEIEAARGEPLGLASGSGGFGSAPYAVDFVRSQLAELYSADILAREGLQIHTTIDTRWQEAAERALREGLERLDREAPVVRKQRGERTLQGAAIVTRPGTGAILAMVGGRDHAASQFNRAVQARRQPGSCFKPFVFAAGLGPTDSRRAPELTLATILEDRPLRLRSGGADWRPENYDREFRGEVTARRALEESLNVPTVRAAQRIGLDRVIATAREAGIDSPMRALPSLALGAVEVTPLELSTAYGTLARLGERLTPWIVTEVTDAAGEPLARRRVVRSRAIDPAVAFLVHDALTGVFVRGTARSAGALGFRGPGAGKTGTTDETRDAWFVGYRADALALVWVGYDDNARTGLTGATGALPIWVDVMQSGPRGDEAPIRPPAGVVQRRIDPESGRLLVRGCPEWRDEWFLRGTEPEAICPKHRQGLFRRLFGGRERGNPG